MLDTDNLVRSKLPFEEWIVRYKQDWQSGCYEKGNHPVSDDFFYNVIEMTTTTEDERVWESHREFYDVHLIFEGRERIHYNFLSNMEEGDYDAEGDWQQMSGQALFDLIFTPGSLLLLDPNDAHKTGLIAEEAGPIRKVVFKVKIV